MRSSHLLVTVALLGLSLASPAGAGDTKASPKGKAKAPMFTMPALDGLPQGKGLIAPKAEKLGTDPKASGASGTYEVVRIQHAKAFQRSGGTTLPVLPLEEIAVMGNPPTSEKFTTVLRIKSPQRASAPIDVVILDARGDTAMSASGKLAFSDTGGEEGEFTVDWDPTPMRAGGQFSMLVRVAGQPLGTFPLKVVVKQ
jgi:hypothetical protein